MRGENTVPNNADSRISFDAGNKRDCAAFDDAAIVQLVGEERRHIGAQASVYHQPAMARHGTLHGNTSYPKIKKNKICISPSINSRFTALFYFLFRFHQTLDDPSLGSLQDFPGSQFTNPLSVFVLILINI